jgi:transposase
LEARVFAIDGSFAVAMDGRELKAYERFKEQAQFYRARAYDLEAERRVTGPELYHAYRKIDRLEQRVEKLAAENTLLKQRLREQTAAGEQRAASESPPAPLIKPSVGGRRRKKPGRKAGHPAALRPMPDHIDSHQEVALPKDAQGRESCPHCSACLLDLEDHERVVEDIIPAKVVVRCYHTRSGWCPCCRKQVESRAPEQPPAANLPHGQLGINVLATAMALRITHRLPFRQVTQVFADLPGLSLSPGAIARQVQRIADWFDGDYEKLIVELRCAEHVYADETGWRTDGKNGFLWAVTDSAHTLYHVDKSRGGKVIRKLLGKAFGGTLVSDFYSAYSTMDCKKQKCLTHLLRELTESADKSPAFAGGSFFKLSKRMIKQTLVLKGQWETLGDARYFERVDQLEKRLKALANADYDEAHAKRIAKRMRKHQKELTAFLRDKGLDGTNNAAERAIRPVVVVRKISGGSRSKNGAAAWATLASLLRTANQQGKNVVGTIKSMLMAAWAADKPPAMPAGP